MRVPDIRMNDAARRRLRRIIVHHQDWPAFMKRHGLQGPRDLRHRTTMLALAELGFTPRRIEAILSFDPAARWHDRAATIQPRRTTVKDTDTDTLLKIIAGLEANLRAEMAYNRETRRLVDLLLKRTGMAWADPEEESEIGNYLMNTEYERERFKLANPDLPF